MQDNNTKIKVPLMKTIAHSDLFKIWLNKCYPATDPDSATDSTIALKKRMFSGFLEEAISEIWEEINWNFTLGLQKIELSKDSDGNIVPKYQFKESDAALDKRILQAWDEDPTDQTKKSNKIWACSYGDSISVSRGYKKDSVYLRYKLDVPAVSETESYPAVMKNMILAKCSALWQASQERFESAAYSDSLFRKYMDDARMQLANSCDDVITVSRK